MPKGIRFHWYLPNGVLKVVKNDEASSSLMCQNPFFCFQLTFRENFCSMQSGADIFNCGQGNALSEPLALLRFFGSKHILSCPFGFTTSTTEPVHSVGVVTSARILVPPTAQVYAWLGPSTQPALIAVHLKQVACLGLSECCIHPASDPCVVQTPLEISLSGYLLTKDHQFPAERHVSSFSHTQLAFHLFYPCPDTSGSSSVCMISDLKVVWFCHRQPPGTLFCTAIYCWKLSERSVQWLTLWIYHMRSDVFSLSEGSAEKGLLRCLCRIYRWNIALRSCIWLKPDGTTGCLQFQGHQLSVRVVQPVCSLSSSCINVHRQCFHALPHRQCLLEHPAFVLPMFLYCHSCIGLQNDFLSRRRCKLFQTHDPAPACCWK